MEYLKLPGDSCFTPAEATKLAARINDLHQVKVELTGVWIHYAHLRHADPETEAKITQLLPVSGVDLEAKLGSKIYCKSSLVHCPTQFWALKSGCRGLQCAHAMSLRYL